MKLFVRTTKEEREWEREHTQKLRNRSLESDVINKLSYDDGYREKISLFFNRLVDEKNWILDVGSHTAGECEFYSHKGLNIIATDINESALEISKERCTKFERERPVYVACDGQNLPFADNVIPSITYHESLHHMPDPGRSLREACRVLVPGGTVMLLEPYAYDPWRRISEIRDYFRGTIETSFSVKQLRRLLDTAGLKITHIERPVIPPSTEKLKYLPSYHRILRLSYFAVRRSLPGMLGMIFCEAKKPGERITNQDAPKLNELLVCPQTKAPLLLTEMGYVSTDPNSRLLYPVSESIPVLIVDDAKVMDVSTWQSVMRSGRVMSD